LNSRPEAGLGASDETPDLLTPEEEGVLASVRNVVDGIWARGLPVDPDSVAGALSAAGFPASPESSGTGGAYRANGARFALRTGAGPTVGIEIRFIRDAT
jgi:hypothetical protein